MATVPNAVWDPILEFLRSDAEIASWLDESNGAERDNLVADSKELYQTFAQVFAFQGFDAKKIIKLLLSRHKAALTQAKTTVTFSTQTADEAVVASYSNHESMVKDVKVLITFFLVRGCRVEKAIVKSDDNATKLLELLLHKYGINTEKRKSMSQVSPDTITLPRVAACFPIIACDIFSSGVGKVMFLPSQIGLTADTFDKCIYSTFFVSCIPRSLITVGDKNPHLFFFLVHVLTDDIIQSKSQDFTRVNFIFDYYAAAYNSNITPESSRLNFCSSKGLLTPRNGAFKQGILTAAGEAEKLLTDLRGDDPGFQKVLQDLKNLK